MALLHAVSGAALCSSVITHEVWSTAIELRVPTPRARWPLRASMIETMTVEKPLLSRFTPKPVLAFDLVQGSLVRWSSHKSTPQPPTAVFLHGILGGRRNWSSFAKRLAREFPSWQFLLVDLRCHGESSQMPGHHTVRSAARDVLNLLAELRLTPRVLVGHSFGGKGVSVAPSILRDYFVVSRAVVLSMIEQTGKPLPRPVQVWVLDATPGVVRPGGDGEDHPEELIDALRHMPSRVPSRQFVVDRLVGKGFSPAISMWMTTNLRPCENSDMGLMWTFDLDGVAAMYESYEKTNLWNVVDNVPQGVHLRFLRAERSLHRWAHEDIQRIHDAEASASNGGAGVELHVLEDAGHWAHADNPDGLFTILVPSFRSTNFQAVPLNKDG